MWNGTMFVDLDWPLSASSLLSASAELLVFVACVVARAVLCIVHCNKVSKPVKGKEVVMYE